MELHTATSNQLITTDADDGWNTFLGHWQIRSNRPTQRVTICSKAPSLSTLKQKSFVFAVWIETFFVGKHFKGTGSWTAKFMPLLSARRHAVRLYFVSVLDFFYPSCFRFHSFSPASQPHSQIRCAANQSTCAVKSVSMSCFTNQ